MMSKIDENVDFVEKKKNLCLKTEESLSMELLTCSEFYLC